MEIIGIDVGYAYTKTSAGLSAPSKFTLVEPLLGSSRAITAWGRKHYIGVGNACFEINKTNDELTRVLTLYSICASTKEDRVKIVTGLPVGQYKAQRDSLRSMLMDMTPVTALYDDSIRAVVVEDAAIYPQGLLPIVGDYISVDIGGRTVEIIHVENNEVVFAKTLYDGMFMLYGKIADKINATYATQLRDEFAERILTDGFFIDGVQQEIAFLTPILSEYVNAIVDEIKKSTPCNITKVMLTGGGAHPLHAAFKKRMPNVRLVDNSQFSNALMFRKVGLAKWQRA